MEWYPTMGSFPKLECYLRMNVISIEQQNKFTDLERFGIQILTANMNKTFVVSVTSPKYS